MAPILRSSYNTPSSAGQTEATTANSTPTRRTPHCTKCKRPRAGHPRQGCPFVDSPQQTITPESPETRNLTDALGSMHIRSPDGDQNIKAATRSRRVSASPKLVPVPTLVSLSSHSSDIVARLLQPGTFSETSDEEDGEQQKILKWQAALATPSSTTPSRKSKTATASSGPGTLNTPSWQAPYTSFTNQSSTQPANATDDPSFSTQTSRPLVRSMTLLERNAFINQLTEVSMAPPATVYFLPHKDIAAVQERATKLGFYSHAIHADDHGLDGCLILGRDEKAVQALWDALQDRLAAERRHVGHFRAAAGGAVVGAMATWTGLAFS